MDYVTQWDCTPDALSSTTHCIAVASSTQQYVNVYDSSLMFGVGLLLFVCGFAVLGVVFPLRNKSN